LKAFHKAIVRVPCENITGALTSQDLGEPEYRKALQQHAAYVDALRQCGLEVITLAPDIRYPDSTFVEDTALLTSRGAIITRPGASSRRGETEEMEVVISEHFENIDHIEAPGTVDAGDILQAEDHYYIGLSGRTNRDGAEQMINILQRMGFQASTIAIEKMLHLKSGAAYLDHTVMVLAGELAGHPAFRQFEQIRVSPSEAYAANCLWLNGTVLVAKGFPGTSQAIQEAGFTILELDMSEFRKGDGGLSCLSLRF
jgi:dimethylargininase